LVGVAASFAGKVGTSSLRNLDDDGRLGVSSRLEDLATINFFFIKRFVLTAITVALFVVSTAGMAVGVEALD
jgi:hypothetical protein